MKKVYTLYALEFGGTFGETADVPQLWDSRREASLDRASRQEKVVKVKVTIQSIQRKLK